MPVGAARGVSRLTARGVYVGIELGDVQIFQKILYGYTGVSVGVEMAPTAGVVPLLPTLPTALKLRARAQAAL